MKLANSSSPESDLTGTQQEVRAGRGVLSGRIDGSTGLPASSLPPPKRPFMLLNPHKTPTAKKGEGGGKANFATSRGRRGGRGGGQRSSETRECSFARLEEEKGRGRREKCPLITGITPEREERKRKVGERGEGSSLSELHRRPTDRLCLKPVGEDDMEEEWGGREVGQALCMQKQMASIFSPSLFHKYTSSFSIPGGLASLAFPCIFIAATLAYQCLYRARLGHADKDGKGECGTFFIFSGGLGLHS